MSFYESLVGTKQHSLKQRGKNVRLDVECVWEKKTELSIYEN